MDCIEWYFLCLHLKTSGNWLSHLLTRGNLVKINLKTLSHVHQNPLMSIKNTFYQMTKEIKNNNNVKIEHFFTNIDMPLRFNFSVGPKNMFMKNLGRFSSIIHIINHYEVSIHFTNNITSMSVICKSFVAQLVELRAENQRKSEAVGSNSAEACFSHTRLV